jgi:hypothetical protein
MSSRMSLLENLRRLFRRVPRSVTFDDEKIVRTRSNGETESVRWDELQSVEIITTADGPWSEDVFWILKGRSGGCAIPQGVQGFAELLKRLQALPGFRDDTAIEAMGFDSQRFVPVLDTHGRAVTHRCAPPRPTVCWPFRTCASLVSGKACA